MLRVCRQLAGTLHAYHHFAEPRFSALLLGHVPPHVLGLCHVFHFHRAVFGDVLVIRPRRAADFDVGAAGDDSGDESARGGPMTPPTPYYGLLAEFDAPQTVLKATRQARREG